MTKLSLNLDDLRVESFVTTPANMDPAHGTVEALSCTIQIVITNCAIDCVDSTGCTDSVSACACDTCPDNSSCSPGDCC